MPIPLPRVQTQIGANFAPGARASSGGIRVSNVTTQRAVGDLNQAVGQGARYRPVDYSGTRELANGVNQLSQSVVALRQRNQEVTDKRLMYDAETSLLAGTMDLEGKLAAEADPNKHEQLAAEHMASVVGSLKLEGMTPEAQQHLTAFAERQRQLTVTKARNSAVVENERRLVQSALALHKTGVATGNPTLAASAIRPLIEGGHISAEEGQNIVVTGALEIQSARKQQLREQVTSAVRTRNWDTAKTLVDGSQDLQPWERQDYEFSIAKGQSLAQVDDMIAQDPAKVYKMLDDEPQTFEGFSPAETQDIRDKAFSQMQNNSNGAYMLAADAFARGTLVRPEQLDEPQWKDMLPARKAALRESLEKGQPNDDQEWMALAASISAFKPTGDAAKDQLAYADMEATIDTRFRGPYQQALKDLMSKVQAGTPADADSAARNRVLQAFKDGYLGNYKVPYQPAENPWSWNPWAGAATPGTPISPKDQARLSSDVPEEQRLKAGSLVTDQTKFAEANKRLMGILRKLDDMKKSGATMEQRDKFADEQIRLSGITPAMPSASDMDGTLYLPLPASGEGPNPSLLPPPSRTEQDLQRAKSIIDSLK